MDCDMTTEIVEMEGHLIDTHRRCRVFLTQFSPEEPTTRLKSSTLAKSSEDISSVRIEVAHKNDIEMDRLLEELQVLGANSVDVGHATLVDCTQDGVLPAGFYSTTNLPTKVVVEELN